MTDLGFLGLDTSHGEVFAEILADIDPQVGSPPAIAAVWDGGLVRDEAYVESFCETYQSVRYDTPAEMVDDVDAALVLTVDWERHVPLARPFLDAGVPTLIDKPIAGSASALDTLAAAVGPAPLFGGSALPFHPTFAELRGGTGTRTLHLAGYNDTFYYRVHAVDAARRVTGADWTAVEPVTATEASAVEVSFADGSWATLRFDGPTDEPVFGALDVSDRTRAVAVDGSPATLREMYAPYLDAFLSVIHGASAPPTDTVLDAATLLLAVQVALGETRPVTPDDEGLDDVTVPSAPFLDGYEPYY